MCHVQGVGAGSEWASIEESNKERTATHEAKEA